MGKRTMGWAAACLLAACGGTGSTQTTTGGGTTGAVDDDGGTVLPERTVSTLSTARGTITSSEAFSVESAQTILQGTDGGVVTYVGVSLTDTGQCGPSDLPGDGGYVAPPEVTHLVRAFVRTLDGAAIQPGTYTLGMTNGDKIQTYAELVEYERDGGGSTSYLGDDGTVTIDVRDGGHLEGHLDVNLGDSATGEDLPFKASFSADACE